MSDNRQLYLNRVGKYRGAAITSQSLQFRGLIAL